MKEDQKGFCSRCKRELTYSEKEGCNVCDGNTTKWSPYGESSPLR